VTTRLGAAKPFRRRHDPLRLSLEEQEPPLIVDSHEVAGWEWVGRDEIDPRPSRGGPSQTHATTSTRRPYGPYATLHPLHGGYAWSSVRFGGLSRGRV
jgi:hypothetical protein